MKVFVFKPISETGLNHDLSLTEFHNRRFSIDRLLNAIKASSLSQGRNGRLMSVFDL